MSYWSKKPHLTKIPGAGKVWYCGMLKDGKLAEYPVMWGLTPGHAYRRFIDVFAWFLVNPS